MTTISDEPRSVTDVAAELAIRAQAYIDGAYVDAASGETFDCVSPIGGEVIATVAACDAADIDRAVAGARATFESGVWSRIAPEAAQAGARAPRRAHGRARGGARAPRDDRHGQADPRRRARGRPEVAPSASPGSARRSTRSTTRSRRRGPRRSLITREPLGVVGAVVPWNFPLLMAAWKLGPALAAGNCVVLKPAEQSPLSALRLAELATEAGHPGRRLQRRARASARRPAQALGAAHGRRHDRASPARPRSASCFLAYSGESNMKRVVARVRRQVAAHRPRRLRPTSTRAATRGRRGIFYNQGEVCNAGSRLLVHEPVQDELLEKVVAVARAHPARRPARPGDAHGRDRRRGASSTACSATSRPGKSEGAGLHARRQPGRARTPAATTSSRRSSTPSRNDMRIAREEIFGPVLSAISFTDVERGDHDRERHDLRPRGGGLDARLDTRPQGRARAPRRHRLGEHARRGDITCPFGGFKQSGFGRDRSLHALDKYTDLKAIWIALS